MIPWKRLHISPERPTCCCIRHLPTKSHRRSCCTSVRRIMARHTVFRPLGWGKETRGDGMREGTLLAYLCLIHSLCLIFSCFHSYLISRLPIFYALVFRCLSNSFHTLIYLSGSYQLGVFTKVPLSQSELQNTWTYTITPFQIGFLYPVYLLLVIIIPA